MREDQKNMIPKYDMQRKKKCNNAGKKERRVKKDI